MISDVGNTHKEGVTIPVTTTAALGKDEIEKLKVNPIAEGEDKLDIEVDEKSLPGALPVSKIRDSKLYLSVLLLLYIILTQLKIY